MRTEAENVLFKQGWTASVGTLYSHPNTLVLRLQCTSFPPRRQTRGYELTSYRSS